MEQMQIGEVFHEIAFSFSFFLFCVCVCLQGESIGRGEQCVVFHFALFCIQFGSQVFEKDFCEQVNTELHSSRMYSQKNSTHSIKKISIHSNYSWKRKMILRLVNSICSWLDLEPKYHPMPRLTQPSQSTAPQETPKTMHINDAGNKKWFIKHEISGDHGQDTENLACSSRLSILVEKR